MKELWYLFYYLMTDTWGFELEVVFGIQKISQMGEEDGNWSLNR